MSNSVQCPGHDDSVLVTARLDVNADGVRAAMALLSPDERTRARRFARVRDSRRYVVARARLRELLGSLLSLRPEAVGFDYGPRGKPALAAWHGSTLRFSVAHADDVAAFAVTRGREVGVDIEFVRPFADADAVASWAFSAREQAEYFGLPARDRQVGFFNCWTRKEAVVKAMGEGLRFPLAEFDVSLAPAEPARVLHMRNRAGRRVTWTLRAVSPAPGVIGAIALGGASQTEAA